MRDLREYAVVMVPGHGSWLDQWMSAQEGVATPGVTTPGVATPDGSTHGQVTPLSRTRGAVADPGVRFFAVTPGEAPGGSARWLGQAALMLRRFDACLLPVEPATLSWARTALAGARGQVTTPMLALVRKLRPAGLLDLTGLGIADFLEAPLDPDELRVRTEMVLSRTRQRLPLAPVQEQAAQGEGKVAWRYDIARDAFHDPSPDDAAAARIAEPYPFDAAAVRLLREHAALLREPPPRLHDPAPARWPHAHAAAATASAVSAWDETDRLIDTPFGRAKAEMVGRFERAYLHRCLVRHGGNVTQAARASAKHRRAFWALMRKHHIRAAPYRLPPDAGADDDGIPAPPA